MADKAQNNTAPPAVTQTAAAAQSLVASSTNPSAISTDPAKYSEIGMATVFGACSGFAAKKLAKTGGLIVGLGFMSIQALVYADILKINWPRVESIIIGPLDLDKDGKLTTKDVQVGTARFIHVLTTDMPSAAGFSAAFLMGFRYG
ncbi:hypothetical protein BJ742DRAFT_807678 [Cladochytrium replicatum]|nr:hypothetical protein BJ742DRAFT_807678 [Cladochytrium replicatum]